MLSWCAASAASWSSTRASSELPSAATLGSHCCKDDGEGGCDGGCDGGEDGGARVHRGAGAAAVRGSSDASSRSASGGGDESDDASVRVCARSLRERDEHGCFAT